MSEYFKRESRTFIEIADDLNDLVTELNDKIAESIREKNVDVALIKYGHWIKISPAGIYECSECGKNVMTSDIEAYEYCHGCGARMDTRTMNRRGK